MADLAGWGGVLRAVNILYWFVAAAAVWIAWRWPSRRAFKFAAAAAVAFLFVAPALVRMYNILDYKIRYAQSKAVFDERCKTAGEKIFRSVPGVTTVHLQGIRKSSSGESQLDPNPFRDGMGDDYIRSFLLPESRSSSPRRVIYNQTDPSLPGFMSVTAIDETDGVLYRYTLGRDYQLQREVVMGARPTYAVTFYEPVIPADRNLWIASSVVRVINQDTGETLGEMTRFVMDPGLGSRAGQRTPWLFARSCNMKSRYDPNNTRLFTSQLLQPYATRD